MDFDLLVIDQDREGIEQAMSAVRAGRCTGIVEATGDMPFDVVELAAQNVSRSRSMTMTAWRREADRLYRQRQMAQCSALERAGVQRISGRPRFITSSKIEITASTGNRLASATNYVLACGTRSRFPQSFGRDPRFVFSVESILQLPEMPRQIVVVGAGETGMAVAIMLARLGIEVVVVDEHLNLVDLCGMLDERMDVAQSLDIAFRLNEEAIGIERRSDLRVAVRLASGRTVGADAAVVCVGREGNTNELNLDAAGVGVDERGRVWCDDKGRTWNPNISVVGDLASFPHQGQTNSSCNRCDAPHSARTRSMAGGSLVAQQASFPS